MNKNNIKKQHNKKHETNKNMSKIKHTRSPVRWEGGELEGWEVSEHDLFWFYAYILKHISRIEKCVDTLFKAETMSYKMNTRST